MIELFASDTPNGKKISIMLEEIKLPYKVTKVNLSEGEQFKEEFVKISPFSKIPVIKDGDNDKSVFGSGAILIYLADKTQKFYHKENKVTEIYKSSTMVTYEVVVLDKDKQYFKFKWKVEKNNKEGNLLDCWLTTAVSQPIPMGSSI